MQKPLDKLKQNPFYIVFIMFFIASFVTVAISATNAATKDIVAEQARIAATNARIEVFPQAANFEEFSDEDILEQISNVNSIYFAYDQDEVLLGLIVISYSRGYGGDISTMAGISTDGTLTGFLVLDDTETPGLGKKVGDSSFTSKFVDRNQGLMFSITQVDDSVNYIDSIAGATISSRAMIESANAALEAAKLVFDYLEIGGM